MITNRDITTIRLYVDGESAPEEKRAVEERLERDAEFRDRVEFERSLRERIGVVLGTSAASAPEGLSEQIRAALASADFETVEEAAPVNLPPEPHREQVSNDRRWSLWGGPVRVNYLAVAACLALVSGAVLWGIFGSPINNFVPGQADMVGDIATFTAQEHIRCADSEENRAAKAKYHDPEKTLEALQEHLSLVGPPPILFDFTDIGYDFYGGGPCMVPGGEPSFHLIYIHPSEHDQPVKLISIFIIPNVGQLDMEPATGTSPLFPGFEQFGGWHTVGGDGTGQNRVLCVNDDRLIYFMVCCDGGVVGDICARISTPDSRR